VLKLYLSALEAICKNLVVKASNGFTFIGELRNGQLDRKMTHFSCFMGGMFALTSMYVKELNEKEKKAYSNLAVEITRTCRESYARTDTQIGPMEFSFEKNNEFSIKEKTNNLQAEVVESYFYLWRMTKENKYRDWAWDVAKAIEKYCKTDSGYSGLSSVSIIKVGDRNVTLKDGVQNTVLLGKTLKYLYLIFSDDDNNDALPLGKYVLNTDAHPFAIKK
jgi:mannosyl-oligosaccharide alpha-1,2-mannosidase